MKKMASKKLLIGLTALIMGGAAYTAVSVRAELGIPSPGALSYKGTLENVNGPVDGVADFTIRLFDSPAMTQELCSSVAPTTAIAAGRFEVELSDACTDAVEKNDEAWILVSVDLGDGDGLQSFPIERIHASAYAVSARKANNGIPVGGMIWWKPLPGAQTPSGYQICDGGFITEGPLAGTRTPDMRNRFIRGTTEELGGVGAVYGSSPSSTASGGAHSHKLFDWNRLSGRWSGFFQPNGPLLTIIDYGPNGITGMPLELLPGAYPLAFASNGTSSANLHSDVAGAHTHSLSEQVPFHIRLVALMRIR